MVAFNDLSTARGLIARCERDLKRPLTSGQKRDLLKDNTGWTAERVARVVAVVESEG